MEKKKQCSRCRVLNDWDATDSMFSGTNQIYLKGKGFDDDNSFIELEMYMDAESKILCAEAQIFGLMARSKPVKIKYCPFCGREL